VGGEPKQYCYIRELAMGGVSASRPLARARRDFACRVVGGRWRANNGLLRNSTGAVRGGPLWPNALQRQAVASNASGSKTSGRSRTAKRRGEAETGGAQGLKILLFRAARSA
jgi:hypothetical protein